MTAPRAVASTALAFALVGCGGGGQPALGPHGPQAGRTLGLFWLFLGVATAVWVLVVLTLGLALWRRRRQPEPDSPLDIDPRAERRGERVVTALVALTALVLVVLTAASYLTGRGLATIVDADA